MTENMQPRSVWITRHGERLDFVDPTHRECVADPYNPPLSANGCVQARDLAIRLRGEGIRHIFASPFQRTLQTAEPLADALDLPIKVERGAGEMLSGEWYPSDPRVWSLADLKAAFPRVDETYVSAVDPVYPEDWEECKRRARRTIQALVHGCEGNLLVVGHGATLSSLAWGLLDEFPAFQGGCCVLIKLVQSGPETWTVELDGDASHLSYREPQLRFV